MQPTTEQSRARMRDLLRLHPKLILASVLVGIIMVPIGLILASVGVAVLQWSGGAARDTSIIVGMAGFLVADFWGGGIVATLTRAKAVQVAAAWALTRIVLLVVVALVATHLAAVVPIQLLLSIPAAWAGAKASRKQAALRRQIAAQRDAEPENLRP